MSRMQKTRHREPHGPICFVDGAIPRGQSAPGENGEVSEPLAGATAAHESARAGEGSGRAQSWEERCRDSEIVQVGGKPCLAIRQHADLSCEPKPARKGPPRRSGGAGRAEKSGSSHRKRLMFAPAWLTCRYRVLLPQKRYDRPLPIPAVRGSRRPNHGADPGPEEPRAPSSQHRPERRRDQNPRAVSARESWAQGRRLRVRVPRQP
jgi:hypothetical protein